MVFRLPLFLFLYLSQGSAQEARWRETKCASLVQQTKSLSRAILEDDDQSESVGPRARLEKCASLMQQTRKLTKMVSGADHGDSTEEPDISLVEENMTEFGEAAPSDVDVNDTEFAVASVRTVLEAEPVSESHFIAPAAGWWKVDNSTLLTYDVSQQKHVPATFTSVVFTVWGQYSQLMVDLAGMLMTSLIRMHWVSEAKEVEAKADTLYNFTLLLAVSAPFISILCICSLLTCARFMWLHDEEREFNIRALCWCFRARPSKPKPEYHSEKPMPPYSMRHH